MKQLFRAITEHFPLDGDKRIDWSDKFFNARDAEIEAKNEEEEEEDDDDEINQSELDELIKDLNRTVISTPLETQQQPSFELSTQQTESTPLETQQQPSSDDISKQQNESTQDETHHQEKSDTGLIVIKDMNLTNLSERNWRYFERNYHKSIKKKRKKSHYNLL